MLLRSGHNYSNTMTEIQEQAQAHADADIQNEPADIPQQAVSLPPPAAPTIPTYRIKTRIEPPKYDPRSEVEMEDFLQEFEDVKELNNWEDKEAVIELRNALHGPVKTAMAKAKGVTYAELKQLLVDRYGQTAEEYYLSSHDTLKVSGADLYELRDNAVAAVERAYGEFLGVSPRLLRQLTLTCFTRSLPSSSMAHVVAAGNPLDVNDAFRIALDFEKRADLYDGTQSSKQRRRNQLRQLEEVESNQERLPEWASTMLRQLCDTQIAMMKATTAANDKEEPKRLACYICGDESHLAKGCLRKKTQANRKPTVPRQSKPQRQQGNE